MQLWLLRNIAHSRKLYTITHDFSVTIAAGARSSDTNITGLKANKIKITGLAISSENDTTWRAKFYDKDSFDNTGYNDNTFIGNIEVNALSANANANYEGDTESALFYWDTDRSKELHVILENTGAVNTSKAFVTFLYNKSD